MQEITITIDPEGAVKVETSGFTGASCSLASKLVEDALGKRVDEQLKPEYFKNDPKQFNTTGGK